MRYGDMDLESGLSMVHIVRPALEQDRPARAGQQGEGQNQSRGTPGLLMMHGRGADEADLMGIEQGLDARLTIVSVRAPFRMGPGFAWYNMARLGEPEEETMRMSLDKLLDFMQGMIKAYNIDPDRLYLMGFSQGAIMAGAIALVVPDKVRSVVMHSGYVPHRVGLDTHPEGLLDKGFFVAHGKYDDIIPVSYGRDGYEYLLSIGARVTYQEYPIGHTISEESLYDLSEWLTGELDSNG